MRNLFMSVKVFIVGTLCLACLCLPMAGLAASEETGAWSPVVQGIQGRLIVSQGEKVNGTWLPHVYLELRNVSDVADPVNIYYGNGEGLRCEVMDSQNKKLADEMTLDFDAMLPPPYEIVLPYDSSLRFRVSVPGWGIPKNAGAFFGVRGGPWIIPGNVSGDYILQGVFSPKAIHKIGFQREWHGTLLLPKVKVSDFAKSDSPRTGG